MGIMRTVNEFSKSLQLMVTYSENICNRFKRYFYLFSCYDYFTTFPNILHCMIEMKIFFSHQIPQNAFKLEYVICKYIPKISKWNGNYFVRLTCSECYTFTWICYRQLVTAVALGAI